MNGWEFRKQVSELGITTTQLSRESGLSVPTLLKIYEDIHVRETSRAKAHNALKRLRLELENPKSQSGGHRSASK